MMSTLYQTNILTGSSLKRQVDMSLCSQTFTSFHASQSSFLLHLYLLHKQNSLVYVSLNIHKLLKQQTSCFQTAGESGVVLHLNSEKRFYHQQQVDLLWKALFGEQNIQQVINSVIKSEHNYISL